MDDYILYIYRIKPHNYLVERGIMEPGNGMSADSDLPIITKS